jgi:hypothetical protein
MLMLGVTLAFLIVAAVTAAPLGKYVAQKAFFIERTSSPVLASALNYITMFFRSYHAHRLRATIKKYC